MLLQIAIDKPEHLGALPGISAAADIIEIGTPLLKRFGIAAITTVRELCPGVPLLADTKTVDGGTLEAEMVFGAGASFMTVLSCASPATCDAVSKSAAQHDAYAVIDTIGMTDTAQQSGFPMPARFAYVSVHAPLDARLAGDQSTTHIERVGAVKSRGYRVSLAGGIGPATLERAIASGPDILVVGSAITQSDNPGSAARWIKERLPDQGRGWPWDRN